MIRKRFLNGVSVYLKQWKDVSALDNLRGLLDVAETTGSGVAVWDLSRSAHPETPDPGWNSAVQLELDLEDQKRAPTVTRETCYKVVLNVLKRSSRAYIGF